MDPEPRSEPASTPPPAPNGPANDEPTERLDLGRPAEPGPAHEPRTAVFAAAPAGGAPPARGTTPSGPRRATLLAISLLSAVLGAGIVVAVLAAAGDLHRGATTTVVQPSAGLGSGTSPAAVTRGVSASALYAQVAAGVVDITATSASQSNGFPFGGGGGSQTDLGSGFEVDGSGDILTAAHVVDGATSITVTFQNGATRSATLLGEDRAWDVAVIHVNPNGVALHPLALGSSRALVVGDYLAAIGDPFGYDRSLSTGVVAGLDRTITAPNGFNIAYAIQTDAALNPGNSGGPVLDADGRVVGIADQIATGGSETASGTATSSGVGFAVPIDLAKIDLARLERGNAVAHGYLGVSTTDAPDGSGVLLQEVQSGTPAAAAGLRVGDVLVAFDGSPLHGSADLIDDIATHMPGNRVTLTVKRGGSLVTVPLTLGTQPSQAPGG